MNPSVLLVDNFDSFTFNLVDELARRGCAVEVIRNTLPAGRMMQIMDSLPAPRLGVISPGPGRPAEAGSCLELIREAGARPLLGVCLGMQAMVEALGGRVGAAGQVVHGKSSPVEHAGAGVFAGLPRPMPVGRYHSLVATKVPRAFDVTARAGELVMAVEHRERPLLGLQFHPESILTPHGGVLMDNVLEWAARAATEARP